MSMVFTQRRMSLSLSQLLQKMIDSIVVFKGQKSSVSYWFLFSCKKEPEQFIGIFLPHNNGSFNL